MVVSHIVEQRYVFMMRRAEKDCSLVAFVAGATRIRMIN